MGRKTNKVLSANEEILEKINDENKMLMDEFMEYLVTTDKSEKTRKVYKSNLNIIMCWLCERARNKSFVDITKRDLLNFQNFMVRNGLSSSRINNIRSTMSSLSNYIEMILDDEYPDFRNIIGKIPPPPRNEVREKTVLTNDDVQELLDLLVDTERYQLACFVAFSLYGGTRKAETIQYKREWFIEENVVNGLYETPLIRTKGRGTQGKKLNKYILKNKVDYYLELWDKERKRLNIDSEFLFVTKEDGQWVQAKESTANSFMETCSRLMDIDLYSHSLRHYYVTYLVSQGIPINVVKDLVGHDSSDTTELYNDIPKKEGFLKYFSSSGEIIKKDNKNFSEI